MAVLNNIPALILYFYGVFFLLRTKLERGQINFSWVFHFHEINESFEANVTMKVITIFMRGGRRRQNHFQRGQNAPEKGLKILDLYSIQEITNLTFDITPYTKLNYSDTVVLSPLSMPSDLRSP